MLPEGWHRSTLGEIARISSGGTPDRGEPSYWGGDVPWVTTGEIQFNTITDTTEKITRAGLKNSSAKLFPPGTLLMAMYGQGKTRGQIAKLAIEASTNQNSAAIMFDGQHDPDFYFHYLSSQYENLRELGHSGGISHLNAGLLKIVPIPVAPLAEQRRIAQILSTWDEAVAIKERLLVTSRNRKRLLISSLISPPPTAQHEASHSWERSTLNQVTTITVSNVNKKSESGERDIQLCNYIDVYYRDHIDTTVKFMPATASATEIAKFSLRKGDVIITKDSETAADIAVAARVTEDVPDLVCGYHLAMMRPDLNRIDPIFLHSYFSLPRTKDYFASRANGVTRFGLPLGAIQDAPIAFPKIEVQRKMGQILANAETEISHLVRDIVLLKTQKQALQSQLLSGKRRVRLWDSKTESST